MDIAILGALAAVEVVLMVRPASLGSRRGRAHARLGVLVACALLFVSGAATWGPRYWLLTLWLAALAAHGAWVLGPGGRHTARYGTSRHLLVSLAVMAVTVVAAAPALAFPEYTPLEPTGEMAVATAVETLTDPGRIDGYTRSGAPRSVTVGFWYPGDVTGTYPLVVFSHGALGLRSSNESLFVELASHGYVVASIDHTHHALVTTDDAGRRSWIDTGYLADLRREDARSDPEESLDLYRSWMDLRVTDIGFVIDHILTAAVLPDAATVHRLVDPGRIGVAGHSLGGAAALGAGRDRGDIRAVVALEAPFMADIEGVVDGAFVWDPDPYPVPVLNVYSDSSWGSMGEWPQYQRNVTMLSDADPGTVSVHLAGTGHLGLTDLALASPVLTRLLDGPASVAASATLRRVNELCLSFFDTHLKGEGAFAV